MVGMQPRRFEREVVSVALPRGRYDDDAGNSGRFHLAQQIVLRERLRPVGATTATRWPRPLRRIGAPDMDLRIDDQHGAPLLFRSLSGPGAGRDPFFGYLGHG